METEISSEDVLDDLFNKPLISVEFNTGDPDRDRQNYNGAVDLLKKRCYYYWNRLNDPDHMRDGNYDDLKAQLAIYEKDFPEHRRLDSPVGKEKGGAFDPGFSVEPYKEEPNGSTQISEG